MCWRAEKIELEGGLHTFAEGPQGAVLVDIHALQVGHGTQCRFWLSSAILRAASETWLLRDTTTGFSLKDASFLLPD